jgi:hypothetical protein
MNNPYAATNDQSEFVPPPSGATRMRLAHRAFWRYRAEEYSAFVRWFFGREFLSGVVLITLGVGMFIWLGSCFVSCIDAGDRRNDIEYREQCVDFCETMESNAAIAPGKRRSQGCKCVRGDMIIWSE